MTLKNIISTTESPELKVLTACMRCYFGTTSTAELAGLFTATEFTSAIDNWSSLIQTAIAQGLMPLLYQVLKKIESESEKEREYVPRSVMAQLQMLNRMNGLNNLSQAKELLRILGYLETSGIEAIAFKGAVLAASAYGNIALRQFNDLDILVHRRDFWQAKAILVSHGYQSAVSEEGELEMFHRHLQISLLQSATESKMFNAHFEPSLLHSDPERSIDLHWGIPPRRVYNPARFGRLWENLNQVMLMGQSVKNLSPELTLIIQCTNVAKEYTWTRSLKQYCDVAQVIRNYADLNWLLALELSSELKNQKLFLMGLSMTHSLLHISLPQSILDTLVKIKLPDLPDQKYDDHLLGTGQGLWQEYIIQIKTLDNAWDSIFITMLHLQLLLKTALSPNQRDREFLSLPKGLFFLYPIFRPIRLLAKHSGFQLVYNKLKVAFTRQ